MCTFIDKGEKMMQKNNKRAIATYAMVSALVLSATVTPVKAAGQWQETNGNWNYTNEGKLTKGWQSIDNNWYAFDETGKMQTGWIASAEHWYFLGGSGIMQNDAWITDTDGSKFYIKGTGVMATDYVKDGFELTADGKAVALADSKSVVLTDTSNLEGTTVEGNLYVDATLAKELLIKGVTVTGKLVLLGDNKTQTKLTITDSNINTISTQTRDSEIVLSGSTTVKNVVLQETTKVTPDKDFKGQVDKIEVQSTTKGEVVVSVPAKEVSSRTFATVDIQAPVDKLAINTNTTVNINADIKEVTINKFAAGTKVEVSKGNTVGTIDTEVKVEVSGSGNVDKVTGAGKDESIVTPKPDKPSTGGGGSTTPPRPTVPDGVGVSTLSDLKTKLEDVTVSEIYLIGDINLTETLKITRPVTLNGNGKTLKITTTNNENVQMNSAIDVFKTNNVIIKNLTVTVNGNSDGWQGYYGVEVYNSTNVELENITSKGADAGILINGSTATLKGTTNVSDNEFGGIEVSNGSSFGETTPTCTLTLASGATIKNDTETYTNPTVWVVNKTGENKVSISGFSLNAGSPIVDGGETKVHHYLNTEYADVVFVTDADKLKNALAGTKDIVFNNSINIATDQFRTAFKGNAKIDLNGKTLTFTGGDSVIYSGERELTFSNGNIVANELDASKSNSLLCPEVGAKLTLDDVSLTTNSVALFPRGNAAEVNVINESVITAGVYGIGTNAGSQENYKVKIKIDESTIISNSENGDNTAVFVNVPSTLNINQSVITGDRQAMLVRGGTANVSDTEITFTAKYANHDEFYASAWNGGNNLPSAPVVIGNVHAQSYLYPTDVTFNNVTINGFVTGVDKANDSKVVVAANTAYTGETDVSVKFTSDKLYKTHVIKAEGKVPTIDFNIADSTFDDLMNDSLTTLDAHTAITGATLLGDEVTITVNGTTKIADISGTGLFRTVMPKLVKAGVTGIKVGETSVVDRATMVTAISAYIDNGDITNSTLADLCKDTVLEISLEYNPSGKVDGQKKTYKFKFVTDTSSDAVATEEPITTAI